MNLTKIKTGVYVCHCGTNIASVVDVAAVADFAAGLEGVTVARDYTYMCSDPGQDLIKNDIQEYGLNRVVVASCSPLMHEPTFRRACLEGGLNPFFFQMANIREHCSWVIDDRQLATNKAKSMVAAAVRRVHYHDPLEMRQVKMTPASGSTSGPSGTSPQTIQNPGVVIKIQYNGATLNTPKLDANDRLEMTLVPNPATYEFKILLKSSLLSTDKINVQILDVQGRTIKQLNYISKEASISTSGLNNGLYFVKIFDSNNKTLGSKKLVIKH